MFCTAGHVTWGSTHAEETTTANAETRTTEATKLEEPNALHPGASTQPPRCSATTYEHFWCRRQPTDCTRSRLNIFNVDETGVYYRLLPKRTYLSRTEKRKTARGTKGMKAKDRVSA